MKFLNVFILSAILLAGCRTAPTTKPEVAASKLAVKKNTFSLPKTVKQVPHHSYKLPQAVILRMQIDPYLIDPGGSNAIITVYKSTSLGMVRTPWKPTAIFPAGRTNQNVTVISGQTYYFYCTATVQPWGESQPSNTVTNTVQ